MTKRPLFTFGPQPPHDEDFDPLLGRSVSDDALAAATDEDNQPVESAASAVSERMDPYSDWFNIQLPGPSAPDGPTAASEADSATPVWTPFKVKQASSPERLDGSPPDASPPPEPSGIDTPDDGPAQSMPPAADEPADAFNTSHEAAGAAETTRQNLTEPAPSVRLPWDDEPILGSKPVPTAPPTQPTGLFGWRAVPVEDWDTPATPKPPVDPWERITAPVRGDIAAASPETDQTTASDPSSEPHPLDGAETTETASAASMVNSGQPKEATPETVDAGDSILDLSHIARPDRVQPEMPEEAATEQDVPELDVPEPAQELEAPFLNSPPVSESDREEVSVSAEAPGPEDPPMVLDESRLAPVLDAPDSAPIAAASRTKPEEAALLEPDPTGYEQTEPEQTRYDQIERAQDERVQAAFARLRAAAAGVTQPFGQERQPVESPALASQPSALTETGNEGAALADPPIEPAYDHPDAPVEPQFDGPAADTGDPDLAEAEAEAEAGAETRTEDMPEGVPVGSDEPVTGAETGLAPVAEEEPASSIESGSSGAAAFDEAPPVPVDGQGQSESPGAAPDTSEVGPELEAGGDIGEVSGENAEGSALAQPVSRIDQKTGADARPRTVPSSTRRPGKPQGRKQGKAVRRKPKGPPTPAWVMFSGTLAFGFALILIGGSLAAPLSPALQQIAVFLWYWVGLALISGAIWLAGKRWAMAAASAILCVIGLQVVVPASGIGPARGQTGQTIGWVNLEGSPEALQDALEQAQEQEADLLILAELPAGFSAPPRGWSMIEQPVPDQPNALAVLSKGNWRATTVPGEPTMARPLDNSVTVIAINASSLQIDPNRQADINRAATRAGDQDTPVIAVGDFGEPAWSGQMKQVAEYSRGTRLRCGGWLGATYSGLGGLFGWSPDHVFMVNGRATSCKIGSGLAGSRHRPLWIGVPAAAATPARSAPSDPQ